MTLLVVGATGTLGRQIVRQALNEGYQVRCLVRNLRKANFLQEWGAELKYGDLTTPETIAPAFVGITAVIDASTTRPTDIVNMKEVDWYGKISLIKAAKVAKVKRFIFFSILNTQNYSYIPLMKFKYTVENLLKESNIPFTIFRFAGFYQGLISQYAVPILEKQAVWVTKESTSISYIDTQDVAKFCIRSLLLDKVINKTFTLGGSKAWNSTDIIKICEKFSGQSASVANTPTFILRIVRTFINFFEWGWNIADRLAFIEVFSKASYFSISINNINKIFRFKPDELFYLDVYLQEYFEQILIKLKDLNYETNLESKRKDLIF
jgi:uncharacterized protein YbjT (DUF2867 family)